MDSYSGDFPFTIVDIVNLLHLRVRRKQANSVYVDCPFCGDLRGRMNVNIVKNVWRCNHCGEAGGMLALYAKFNHTSTSEAYWEIGELLCEEFDHPTAYSPAAQQTKGDSPLPGNHLVLSQAELTLAEQSEMASPQEIHQTLFLLMQTLPLQPAHRNHLRSPKRGLSDEQIDRLGLKSTPPPFLCRSITERLIKQGCTVEGVPGFYEDKYGHWTMNFYRKNAGILIPAVGFDGRLKGLQILLDVPIKQKGDPPDKPGAKYIWFSSSSKNKGVTSGTPIHLVGDPSARVVYVIEGLLKADISHCLTGRTFAALAGANNTAPLEPLFAFLAQNGTEEIIEAHDMDKYNNQAVMSGASKIYLVARKYGMNCRRLTWNPNYKGFDDWQLALRRASQRKKEIDKLSFKMQYLWGLCEMSHIEDCTEQWHHREETDVGLMEYLGLTQNEYEAFLLHGLEGLTPLLDSQRKKQRFVLYQLELGEGHPIPFAFKEIGALEKAGYNQPPAAQYRAVWAGEMDCPTGQSAEEILKHLFSRFREELPEGCNGRQITLSDVIELDCSTRRTYYYVNGASDFRQVRFSPMLAKKEKMGGVENHSLT